MSREEQEAVYAAQTALWGHGRRFDSLPDVVHYVSVILDAQWFTEVYGYLPPVTIQRGLSSSWGGGANLDTFTITLVNFREPTILHELAHLCCGEKGHGSVFVRAYLHLIRNAMGFFAWAEFNHALDQTKGIISNG